MQDLLEVFDEFIANRRKEHKDPHKGKFCDDKVLVLVCRAALRSVANDQFEKCISIQMIKISLSLKFMCQVKPERGGHTQNKGLGTRQ
jgi:hypothetical protein